jgi:3-oxoacyl-[acyl-carrier protein] reductase
MVDNKNILVSGVTSGMGLAFIILLQEKGYNIFPIVRNKDNISNAFNKDNVIEYDFSKPETIEKAFSGLNIKIDAFVNFAGILPGKSIFEQTYNGLQEVFNVNTISPMLIVKNIQNKLNSNATIILLGSISGQKGSFDDPYAASKGAIHSLVKSLSLKFAPDIRVIGVAPGITNNTRMTDDLIDGLYEKNIQKVPLKCAAQPEDIGKLILFLMSSHAKFITGSIVDINGGQYLR